MADFAITLSNFITLLGGDGTNKWGVMLWSENWGSSQDVQVHVSKTFSESISLSDALSTIMNFNKTFSPTISLDGGPTNETLRDSNGYEYVFPSSTTNAEDRALTAYSEVAEPSTSYSSSTATSTSWSEV